jgi:hypothetical protein
MNSHTIQKSIWRLQKSLIILFFGIQATEKRILLEVSTFTFFFKVQDHPDVFFFFFVQHYIILITTSINVNFNCRKIVRMDTLLIQENNLLLAKGILVSLLYNFWVFSREDGNLIMREHNSLQTFVTLLSPLVGKFLCVYMQRPLFHVDKVINFDTVNTF